MVYLPSTLGHVMFPKGVRRASAASASSDDGYEVVPSQQARPADAAYVREREEKARGRPLARDQASQLGAGEAQRQVPVVKASLPALMAGLGFESPEEAVAALRDELLAATDGRHHEGTLADWKHYYNPYTATPITTTEQSFSLCSVTGGTSVSSRMGNTIRVGRCRLKLYFNRLISGAATAAARDPNITVVIFRDKIPTTPGTIPTVRGTDANPPASATLIFSSLGQNTPAGIAMPVRNPITEDAYHIYKVLRVKFPTSQSFTYTGTTLGMPGPHSVIYDLELDLSCYQRYASYGATASDDNNLWCCIWSDVDYTNYGFGDSVAATVDTEFEDVQV